MANCSSSLGCRARGANNWNWKATAVILVLLACSTLPSADAVVFKNTATAPQAARECLLRKFNSTTSVERKVFSQLGEDGIIESIFECMGTTNRHYVEFGVGDATECTHRNLRENHNFSGLSMDGGNYRPEINLQKEFIYSFNIVQLFQKHKVPYPVIDHATVDLDQNTFWVALAMLRGGYRPRSLTVEFNRNFPITDSYATVDVPEEMNFVPDACEKGCAAPPLGGDCYFGASAKAFVTMLKPFGYHFVATDTGGVNLFFVHSSAAGHQPLLTLEDAKRLFAGGEEWAMLNVLPCNRMVWVAIGDDVDYVAPDFKSADLPLVMLAHKPAGRENKQRVFYAVKHVDVMFKQSQVGWTNAQRVPSTLQQVVQHGPTRCTAMRGTVFMEGWVMVTMLAAAFMVGSMCRQLGSALLRGLGRKRGLHAVLHQW